MEARKQMGHFGFAIFAGLIGSCGIETTKEATEDSGVSTQTSVSTGVTTGTSTSSKTSAETTNKVSTVASVAELKLAGTLAITLPDAFKGAPKTSGLALMAGKKSQEACMMGMTISEEVRSLGEVGGFFCHIELEKDRVKFGRKYRIMTNMGEFARIFIDNSQASQGKLSLGFCSTHSQGGETDRSRQLITIDQLTENGPKGSILTAGSGTYQGISQTYGKSQSFDSSVAGVINLVGKTMHKQTGNTFVREVSLELKKSGISTLKLANKGTSTGGEFFDRGLALVAPDKGAALFQSKGTFQGQSFEFARRAYFNTAGEVLNASDVGPELQPAVAAMPPYLPADFAPDTLTGWVGQDCPDFDEDVTIDPNSPAHQACDQGRDQQYDCWQQANYESGKEDVLIK